MKRRTVLKLTQITALLLAAVFLETLGSYYCVMMSDAIGIPLLMAGFFVAAALGQFVQDWIDHALKKKNANRPIYATRKTRKREPLPLVPTVFIYVDMDGVLAKWNANASIEDTKRQGYFLEREPERVAVRAVRMLYDAGYNVCILSAAYSNGYADKEKGQWLDAHGLGQIPRIFVPYGENKTGYMDKSYTCILIDDYSRNLHHWVAEGNVGIKFYNSINGTHGTWGGDYVSSSMTASEIVARIVEIAVNLKGHQAAA